MAKTLAQKREEKDHAYRYFRRYVKPGTTILCMVMNRTHSNEYLRFFIVRTNPPRLDEITYSVATLFGYRLKSWYNHATMVRSVGIGGIQSVIAALNSRIWGDDASNNYQWTEL